MEAMTALELDMLDNVARHPLSLTRGAAPSRHDEGGPVDSSKLTAPPALHAWPRRSIGGAVSSLVRKGLLVRSRMPEGSAGGFAVALTREGFLVWRRHYAEGHFDGRRH